MKYTLNRVYLGVYNWHLSHQLLCIGGFTLALKWLINLTLFLVRSHPLCHLNKFDACDGPTDDADQISDSGFRHLQTLSQPILRRHRRLPR